jgi:hypothetical protein
MLQPARCLGVDDLTKSERHGILNRELL